MITMSVQEAAQAVSGRIVPVSDGMRQELPADLAVTGVATDSRQVRPGSVFVAIAGERVDGHDFLASAASAGALAAIVDHEVSGATLVQIVVDDTVRALGALAKHNLELRRALPGDFSIVGITGSVGKTTTKDLLHALLGELGPTVAPVGSFNNNIGMPLTALQVDPATRFLIAEMGANHVGEISRLTAIAPPDVSVVLKVGTAHLGEFGSVERIARAKSEIVRGLVPHGVSVLNADDPRVAAMASLAPGEVLWFAPRLDGQKGPQKNVGNAGPRAAGTLVARNIEIDGLDHPRFTMQAAAGNSAGDHGGGSGNNADAAGAVTVWLGLTGRHNVANALAAAAVARHFGMSLEQIARGLGRVERISPHRMAISQVEEEPGVCFTLIDDSFNANPDSMKAGLDGLAAWQPGEGEPVYRIAVLGAMLELGDSEGSMHEQIGAYAVHTGIDALIAVGSDADAHLDALAAGLARGASRESEQRGGSNVSIDLVHGIEQARGAVRDKVHAHSGVIVLLKGSHACELDELAEQWTASSGKA
ncbi:UDP-N-acetylmuramoyl-tripeptide--D-alanyl-D-alanine ligase [Bifidobacterium sp.]|jgi:UDP-N-acetylmuramoyl-tripeptide--D-alanyl-D-alanine ligase|uniref:UDP-N-acetylmuramoyl-tripeptide--D-alanyl-D- alanine ligase n=1 Tax=Bifidobacterium sp. TaxID=41200 RepID=UPI0025C1CCBC|nr:UDP-N-acetylmuramoyl-tripeptide--D-alanyl-D-alanine ligase [Bifidobacterium sp.]MCH4209266.1 UDP-N-acetylmuramoyl-tripeptide--D-alanyl-D-alanine ligase [Bifidobacterium sp.]MCI1224060.1 UDP-N-acetylmuramoyl-tripeptide--D-alanyl-D-alanine ligase [Bifidobacterium sp.]